MVPVGPTLPVGPPNLPQTQIGPLVSKVHLEKVQAAVNSAIKNDKAIVETGYGNKNYRPCQSKGYYFPPTVMTGVSNRSKICRDEVFGPIACLIPFETESEVIQMANDTEYGLEATVVTENLSRAHRVAHQIQAGMIWINQFFVINSNMPFGGFKSSGIGREGGKYSHEFFTEVKTVSLKIDLDKTGTDF